MAARWKVRVAGVSLGLASLPAKLGFQRPDLDEGLRPTAASSSGVVLTLIDPPENRGAGRESGPVVVNDPALGLRGEAEAEVFLLGLDVKRGADQAGSDGGGGDLEHVVKLHARQVAAFVLDRVYPHAAEQEVLDELLTDHRVVGVVELVRGRGVLPGRRTVFDGEFGEHDDFLG